MKRVREFMRGAWGKVLAVTCLATVGVTNAVSAADSITIPAMPVDFADLGTKAAVILGTVIAGIIGLKVISIMVQMGIRWLSRMVS
ncbi:MAG: hypothetical protein LIQ31_01760 [Planctomycetes bacterium]|nr:hypothetical protein [Planctomycetota bacterium]